jgi:hypothetical protein
MNYPKSTIDSVSVTRATDSAISYSEDMVCAALAFLRDDCKKQRLAEGLCKFCFCFRKERIGGAAMTTQPCGICEQDQHYGSTATDKLCLSCAVQHQVCKQCGADVHLRPRRIFKK